MMRSGPFATFRRRNAQAAVRLACTAILAGSPWLAALAAGALVGCSRLETLPPRFDVVRLEPDISRTRTEETTETIDVEAAGKKGTMRFRASSAQVCTVREVGRFRVDEVSEKRAEGLGGAFTYSILALVGAAVAVPVGFALREGGGADNEKTGAGVLVGAAIAGVSGLIILPRAIYHAAAAGEHREEGDVQQGDPSTSTVASSRRPSPSRAPGYGQPRYAPPVAERPATVSRPYAIHEEGTTSERPCEHRPLEGADLALVLRDDDGGEYLVELGTTNAAGVLQVNVVEALAAELGGWPEAGARHGRVIALDDTAAVVRADDRRGAPLGTFSLSAYPGLRYERHQRYVNVARQHEDQLARERREQQAATDRCKRLREEQERRRVAERERALEEAKERHARCMNASRARCAHCGTDERCRKNCLKQQPACPAPAAPVLGSAPDPCAGSAPF